MLNCNRNRVIGDLILPSVNRRKVCECEVVVVVEDAEEWVKSLFDDVCAQHNSSNSSIVGHLSHEAPIYG